MEKKPFTTDGCSAGMTKFWQTFFHKNPPWEGCCEAHDLAYWVGGPKEKRLAADTALRKCVSATGHPIWAFFIFWAVRVFGHPYFSQWGPYEQV